MNKNKISGIYAIICSANGGFYSGSSNNITSRKNTHFSTLKRNKHHCSHLQNAYNKYGEGTFFFIICEECPKDQLLIIEQKYLDAIKQFKGGQCLNSHFIANKKPNNELSDGIHAPIHIVKSNLPKISSATPNSATNCAKTGISFLKVNTCRIAS